MPSYEIVLPAAFAAPIRAHLLEDRSREQFLVTLCGIHRQGERVRLLVRRWRGFAADEFDYQHGGGLALKPDVQRALHRSADAEGLVQVHWHTHPGESPGIAFSRIDDDHERRLAAYMVKRDPSALLGSVVLNTTAAAARLWAGSDRCGVEALPLSAPDLETPSLLPAGLATDEQAAVAERFDRQVRAFGPELQTRLGEIRVVIIGVGGLGSILAEQSARLGVRHFVLIDPDHLSASNLNRVVGATARDVADERSKVAVAARNIRRIDPGAEVRAIRASLFAPRALTAATSGNLLIVATDDHASRLVANALACQYLLPLIHVGVNLEPDGNGGLADMSGEVALPAPGSWCLCCAGLIDSQRAGFELAPDFQRSELVRRGYLDGVPAPAVYHLNGIVASLAMGEIHNMVWQYKAPAAYVLYRGLQRELLPAAVEETSGCLHCSPKGRLALGDLAPPFRPVRAAESMLQVARSSLLGRLAGRVRRLPGALRLLGPHRPAGDTSGKGDRPCPSETS